MYDLRNKESNKKTIWYYFSKIRKKHFLYLLLLLILIYPETSGELIGNWIHDFLITIINIVKNVG